MKFWIGNARFFILFSVAVFVFGSPASAQDFRDRSDAQFVLLGPRLESGLIWEVERQRDEALCALTQDQIRQRLKKSSSAVVAAAFEILREARARCGNKTYDYFGGFYASLGVGGQFDLGSSTETQNIGSNGVFDPVDLARKVGLGIRGVVGQAGIGYDWKVGSLFSPKLLGTGGSFIGVKADVTFGGSSSTINGIPGIVPFVPANVASMDRLRFRNDYTFDFTARVGTHVTPTTAIYALGGVSLAQISLNYDCPATGFCGFGGATPAFSSETKKWTTGAVIGAGIETQVAGWLGARAIPSIDAAALSLYAEYRAHLREPVTIDVGSVQTRSTSQQVDLSDQILMAGGRIRF